MRILFVSDEPRDPSMGGPKAALKLQAGLRRLGHTCDLLFRPDLGARPRSERLRLAASPWLARGAVRRAQAGSGPYDVIDAASAEGWMLGRGAVPGPRGGNAGPVAGPRCGDAGPVVVARSHGIEHRYYRQLLVDAQAGILRKPWTHRWWFPLARLTQVEWALRRARRVILLNERDREWVLARGWQSPERIEVIPHGVDRRWWEQAPAPAAERGGGILFCGWWTSSKGGTYLAQAHRLLLQRGLRIPVTLLGAGPDDATWPRRQAQARACFGAESQPLLRTVARLADEAAVFAEYRRHDLLVCPSTSEGFGMVVIEALSQRLPVVCSRAAGAAGLLEDQRHAWLVPPRDAEALAAAIERLWNDPERRRGMGEAGRERVRDLNWDQIAARTAACYARALAG